MTDTMYSFVFYLSDAKEDDISVLYFLQNHKILKQDTVFRKFRLEYTPPYQEFSSLRRFQRVLRYRPFMDSASRKMIMLVDLSEWIGHEEEEYLEVFLRFLHDYRSFFQPRYVFSAGVVQKEEVYKLYRLISGYLPGGEMMEDHILSDSQQLCKYLCEKYPLSKPVAARLGRIIAGGRLTGLACVNMVVEDFVERMHIKRGAEITDAIVFNHRNDLQNSKVHLFFEEDTEKWLNQIHGSGDKEVREDV